MTPVDHNRGSPRLLFTKEELENPELKEPIKRVQKAEKKLDKAQKKLQTHRQLVLSNTDRDTETKYDTEASIQKTHTTDKADPASPVSSATDIRDASGHDYKYTRTRTQSRVPENVTAPNADPLKPVQEKAPAKTGSPATPAKKQTARLHFEENRKKPPSKMQHPITRTVNTELHRTAAQANEDDNTAATATLKLEESSESVLQMGDHAYHAHKLRPYKQAEQAQKELDKANIRYLQKQQQTENPQFTSNPYSRWQQKRAIKKEYAAAKAGRSTKATQNTAKAADKAAEETATVAKKVAETVKQKPKLVLVGLLAGMLMMIFGAVQSCTPLAQSILESVVIGTYPAEEDDVRAAERAYADKEKALKDEMDHYSRFHPGYDEYNVDAAEIWHDPYVLIAIISAYYDGEDWDIDKAYPVIEKYFELQYIVTEDIVTETRYKTETRSGSRIVYDPDTGQSHTEHYTYDVDEPYTYTICNVTLENRDLSHLPVLSMSHHTMGMYALYMATHGNMEGIFRGKYATPLKDPMQYDIPQETLDADPTFAILMEEANKYFGYPYVWGGASPETSFDCSGFVSYVFTNSGVYDTGRLGANGLYDLCHRVSEEDVRPGDLVFFEGTMGEGTDGITHVGIYVGNNMMMHCGSPIGYANLNDSYWRQHFHSYGRIPY